MPITPLPTPVPQSTQSQANFDAAADAFLTALPNFAAQANQLQTEVNTTADQVADDKTSVNTAAAQAAASAASAIDDAGSASESLTAIQQELEAITGAVQFFLTFAAADAAKGGMPDQQVVAIMTDEQNGGRRTLRRLVGSTLTLIFTYGTAAEADTGPGLTQVPTGQDLEDEGISTLRADLASTDAGKGAELVARLQADSMFALAQLPKPNTDGFGVELRAFYDDTDAGGGRFYWDAGRDKATANGGTIIDPDNVGTLSATALGDFLDVQGTGSGTGCLVRILGSYVSPEMYGAKCDGVSDDSQSISATMDSNEPVRFPNKIAVKNTIQFKGLQRSFHFENTTISVLPGGVFNDVIIYGSGADTGKDVVLSIGNDVDGCRFCTFTGVVRDNNASSGLNNLVFLAAEKLGFCYSNRFDVSIRVYNPIFSHAVYGQGTTSPVAGSFTGSVFSFIETGSNTGGFYLAANQDDAVVLVLRDRGRSELSTYLTIYSYFMYGNQDAPKIGVTIGNYGSLTVLQHFIEGGFTFPVHMVGPNSYYKASIRVSQAFSSETTVPNHVVLANNDRCVVEIDELPLGKQGSHDGYISRHGGPNSGRFHVKTTAFFGDTSFKTPISYSNPGAGTVNDLIIVEDAKQLLFGDYNSSDASVRYVAYDPSNNVTRDSLYNPLGSIFPSKVRTIDVLQGGTYVISGSAIDPSNITVLNTDTAATINTYGAREGERITLMAGGAGNVTIQSSGTANFRFENAATSLTLISNKGSAVTIIWDGTQWNEESRITY